MFNVDKPTTDSISLILQQEHIGSEINNRQDIVLKCSQIPGLIGVILLLVLPLVSLIMIKLVLNGSSTTAYTELALWSDILLIITYIVSVIGLCVMLHRNEDENRLVRDESHTKYSSISVALLFILGCGDSLFNLTRTIDQFLLTYNANSTNCFHYILISAIENFLKSFYQLCLLIFIIEQIIGKVKLSSRLGKSFLVSLACSIFCQWLLLLFQEIDQDERKNDTCTSNSSNTLYSFEKIEPFLYPLGLEFRVSIVIHLLVLSHVKFTEVLRSLKCLKRFCYGHKFSWKCSTDRIQYGQCCRKFWNFVCIIMIPAIGILMVSGSMVFIFFQEANVNNDNHHQATLMSNIINEKINLYSEIGELILVGIICLLSIYSILWILCKKQCCSCKQSDESKQHIEYEFWIDFIVLVISFLFLAAYCILACRGAILTPDTSETIVTDTKRLTIAVSLLSILQTALQVFVILWYGLTGKSLPPTVNKLWIIFNFALWLFDTFSAKDYVTNEIQIAYYTKERWEYLNAILVPMTIFFRFHSCIMFTNIKDRIYLELEQTHP